MTVLPNSYQYDYADIIFDELFESVPWLLNIASSSDETRLRQAILEGVKKADKADFHI